MVSRFACCPGGGEFEPAPCHDSTFFQEKKKRLNAVLELSMLSIMFITCKQMSNTHQINIEKGLIAFMCIKHDFIIRGQRVLHLKTK